MNTHVVGIKEAFSFGWTTFKSRPWFFVRVGLLIVGFSILVGLAEDAVRIALGDSIADTISGLDSLLTSALVSAGMTVLFLKAHASVESANLKDLWAPKLFLRFLGLTFVGGILTILGFVCLIIPGIFLMIAFSFSDFAAVEKDMGPIEALKESWRVTKGHRLHLLLFGLAALAINILGFLALFVGLLVTTAVTQLAFIHLYRSIENNQKTETPEVVG